MIDPRLFPLLETLSASNLDWLVVDVLGVITAGEVALELEDALARARYVISRGRERRADGDLHLANPRKREWSGDEQVKMAAEIVLQRIDEVLIMSEASIASINSLFGGSSETRSIIAEDGIAYANDEGERRGSITAEKVGPARESSSALRRAVEQRASDALRRAAT